MILRLIFPVEVNATYPTMNRRDVKNCSNHAEYINCFPELVLRDLLTCDLQMSLR